MRGFARFGVHRWQHPVETLNEVDVHFGEIKSRIIVRQHILAHFGNGTGHFNARWPTAHNDEV